MSLSPKLLPALIQHISARIAEQAEAITLLDQTLGDGDHLLNLQRGLEVLNDHSKEISQLSWTDAWQKMGMLIMSAVGGASGMLYATLFLSLHKNSQQLSLDLRSFAQIFSLAISAVKQRGKTELGEKTLLDVWIPVAESLHNQALAGVALQPLLIELDRVAALGLASTRDMLASKGRASFLGERSRGHLDAGAQTAQIILAAVVEFLLTQPSE
jgi:dihydroxyacetone kinase-like protein